MNARVRTLVEGGDSEAEQTTELSLPARVLVTVTIPGRNVHVRIQIDKRGFVTVLEPAEVPITAKSYPQGRSQKGGDS